MILTTPASYSCKPPPLCILSPHASFLFMQPFSSCNHCPTWLISADSCCQPKCSPCQTLAHSCLTPAHPCPTFAHFCLTLAHIRSTLAQHLPNICPLLPNTCPYSPNTCPTLAHPCLTLAHTCPPRDAMLTGSSSRILETLCGALPSFSQSG